MVIANRAGVEEGVTFAGESMVAAPDGEILSRGPQADPAVLDVTLDRQAIRRARSPFAHLRDEDPHFFRRALDQILEGR
jgi:predicted amidohydrolase